MSLIGKIVEFLYGVANPTGHWFAESGLNPRNLQNSFKKKPGDTDEVIRMLAITADIQISSVAAPGTAKNFTGNMQGRELSPGMEVVI